MGDNIVGTSVIGVALDTSGIDRDLTRIDSKMRKTLSKARAMPLNILPKVMGGSAIGGGKMMGGTTVPFGGSAMATGGGPVNPLYNVLVDIRMFTQLTYKTLGEIQLGGVQRISAGRSKSAAGKKRGAGLLSRFGISGMAPYVRAGGQGLYGGVSGIDLMGTLGNFMGKGRGGKAVAGAAGGKAAAGGVSAGTVAAGAGASVATAGVVAAIIGIYMVTKKLLKVAKETSAWKFIKSMFQGIVGAFLSIPILFLVTFQRIFGNIKDLLSPIFGPFIVVVGAFIDFFAEKSLKERFEEALESLTNTFNNFTNSIQNAATTFFGGVRSGADYIWGKVTGAADYISTEVPRAIAAGGTMIKDVAFDVYGWFSKAGTYVKERIIYAGEYIGNKFVSVGEWIRDEILNPLQNLTLGDIWSGMKNVTKNIATTLYGAFINYFINPIANVFKLLINFIIGWANKIPGVNIKYMGNVEFDDTLEFLE